MPQGGTSIIRVRIPSLPRRPKLLPGHRDISPLVPPPRTNCKDDTYDQDRAGTRQRVNDNQQRLLLVFHREELWVLVGF